MTLHYHCITSYSDRARRGCNDFVMFRSETKPKSIQVLSGFLSESRFEHEHPAQYGHQHN